MEKILRWWYHPRYYRGVFKSGVDVITSEIIFDKKDTQILSKKKDY